MWLSLEITIRSNLIGIINPHFRVDILIFYHPIFQKRDNFRVGGQMFFTFTLQIPSQNLNPLISVLLENDYSFKFIFDNTNNHFKSLINKQTMKQKSTNLPTPITNPFWFIISFILSIFEKFNSSEIRVFFFSLNKLHKFIKVHKDPLPHNSKNSIVYRISCDENCDASYVGQTDRQLKTRISGA